MLNEIIQEQLQLLKKHQKDDQETALYHFNKLDFFEKRIEQRKVLIDLIEKELKQWEKISNE